MVDDILHKFQAKHTLLSHLHSQGQLHADLFDAAKQALGAEVAAALPDVARAVLAEIEPELRRLETRNYREGDRIRWRSPDGVTRVDPIIDADMTPTVNFNGQRYSMDKGQAYPAEYDGLRALQAACRAIIG